MIIRIIIPYKSVGLESDALIYSKTIKKIIPNTIVIISKSDDVTSLNTTTVDDIHIYISNADNRWFKYTNKKYFMVNHELFYQSEKDRSSISSIDVALCRTHVGSEWAQKVKSEQNFKYEVRETKFTTFFTELNITKHWHVILHSAGEHHWKQTDAVIKAWQSHPNLPLIIITCTNQCLKNIEPILKKDGYPKNMHFHKKMLEYDEFVLTKNKIGMHLCPSIVEGYGHYINEARKVKSLVITTNMAPMNELIDNTCGVLIDCSSYGTKKNGAPLCFVTDEEIYRGVMKAVNLTIDERKALANIAYSRYLEDTHTFEASIVKMLS
jgi:hypothetical protein